MSWTVQKANRWLARVVTVHPHLFHRPLDIVVKLEQVRDAARHARADPLGKRLHIVSRRLAFECTAQNVDGRSSLDAEAQCLAGIEVERFGR